MNWTLPRTKPAQVHTCWRCDEIVVSLGTQSVDRLRAGDIERVTLIHGGEGESPAEVRAVLFETAERAVLLGAASGIAGRVLFERQAYWSQRNCIYWICEQRVAWPPSFGGSRWPFVRPRLPGHRSLTPSDAASLFDRSDVTGPHTWEQRKQHRIERRRPFPGWAVGGATAMHGGALN